MVGLRHRRTEDQECAIARQPLQRPAGLGHQCLDAGEIGVQHSHHRRRVGPANHARKAGEVGDDDRDLTSFRPKPLRWRESEQAGEQAGRQPVGKPVQQISPALARLAKPLQPPRPLPRAGHRQPAAPDRATRGRSAKQLRWRPLAAAPRMSPGRTPAQAATPRPRAARNPRSKANPASIKGPPGTRCGTQPAASWAAAAVWINSDGVKSPRTEGRSDATSGAVAPSSTMRPRTASVSPASTAAAGSTMGTAREGCNRSSPSRGRGRA